MCLKLQWQKSNFRFMILIKFNQNLSWLFNKLLNFQKDVSMFLNTHLSPQCSPSPLPQGLSFKFISLIHVQTNNVEKMILIR